MKKEPRALDSHWPLTFLSGLAALGNIALPLVLVRLLSPAEIGRYKLFFLYLGLMPWLSLSAGVTNGLYHWGSKAEARRYFQSSWTLLLVLAIAAGAVVFGFTQWTLLAVGSVFVVTSNFHEEALVASGRTWKGAIFGAVFEWFRTAIVLVAAFAARNLEAVLIAYLAGVGLKSVIGIVRGRIFGFQKLAWELPSLKEVLRYAGPVSIAALLGVITHFADQLVLAQFATASYFAGYTLGCLTIPPLNSFEQAVNRVLIPVLGREERAEPLREAIGELSWILIPATTGLVLFSRAILELLFTSSYGWTAISLRWYALGYLLYAFPYDALARARGQSGWILKNLVVSFVLAAILIPCLAYYYLGIGAVIGLLVTQLTLRVGGWIYLKTATNWKTSEVINVPEILGYVQVCAILSALSWAASFVLGRGVKWFLVCGPIFAVVYLATTIRLRRRSHLGSRPAILMVTQYLETGGLERMILSLCRELQGEANPRVFAYDRRENANSLEAEFEQAGVPVEMMKKGRGFSFRALLRILTISFRDGIAVVHTHDLGPLMYCAIAKCLSFGALRIVHTQHSFVHLEARERHATYEKIFSRFADRIVTVAPDLRATYESLGIVGVQVISNGVEFAPPLAADPRRKMRARLAPALLDRVWVVNLARIHPKKGQVAAIELWKKLPAPIRARAALFLVGQESAQGELSRLRALARGFDEIVFPGPTREPMHWLACADVYLSLSEFEGLPLGPLEAYGSGLPLVLSRIPGHELFQSGVDWIDLSKGDASVISRAIERAAALSANERAKNYETVASWRERYGAKTMADEYLKIYRSEFSS